MNLKKLLLISSAFAFLSCSGNSDYVVSGKVLGLDGTLVIQNSGKDDLTIQQDGTFTFSTRLTDKQTFDVKMYREPCAQRCEIKNGSGTISGKNPENIEIDCLAKTWSDQQRFLKGTEFENMDPSLQGLSSVAMDKLGNIIVTWSTTTILYGVGSVNKLYKSEFRDGVWHYPKPDENLQISTTPVQASLAMNDNGQAIIAWVQKNLDGTNGVYRSIRQFDVWTKPSLLSDQVNPEGLDATGVRVAIDNSGNMIIVWGSVDSSNQIGLYKSEYRNGVWSDPKTKDDKFNFATSGYPTAFVAMNNSNESIIVWSEYDGTDINLFKMEYEHGKWSEPVSDKDHFFSGSPVLFDLKINDSGDIVLAYHNVLTSSHSGIYISERRSGVWHHPASLNDNINPDGELAFSPQIGLADNGDTLIVWPDVDMNNEDIFRTLKSERKKWKVGLASIFK